MAQLKSIWKYGSLDDFLVEGNYHYKELQTVLLKGEIKYLTKYFSVNKYIAIIYI